MDLQVLKTELENSAYSAMSDEEAANALNEPAEQIDRDEVTAGLLMSALVESEYDALPARGKTYFNLLIQAGTTPATATVKQAVRQLFPAGSQTRANLLELLKRPGSRAEEIGLGRVNPSLVADARRL